MQPVVGARGMDSATCGGVQVQPVVGSRCNLWWGPARGMDSATCSGGQLGVWIVQPVVGAS